MKRQLMRLLASGLIVHAAMPLDVLAQPAPGSEASPPNAQPTTTEPATAQPYTNEQLDALLAPIALYPDPLLAQLLMASTYPLQVVEASRWLEDPAHRSLTGDALTQALNAEPWDASVKSLVPFPVVLAMLNNNLDWMQQLGYAFATQQADVFDAIQRLRAQAQAKGSLQSSQQQVVRAEAPAGGGAPVMVIEPTQPDVVYVPYYNPATVYGVWPYPTYRPVVLAPPPGYGFSAAVATGLAFAAGAAVIGGLWGWARPAWGGAGRTYVNVNVQRYNVINVNRTTITSSRWEAPRVGGRPAFFPHPPGGPVGMPARLVARLPGPPIGPGPLPPVFRPGGLERPPPAYFPPGSRPPERPPERPLVTVPRRPPERPQPLERPPVTLPARPAAPPPRPVAPLINPNPTPGPPPVHPPPLNLAPPVSARPPGPPPDRPPPPRPPGKPRNESQP